MNWDILAAIIIIIYAISSFLLGVSVGCKNSKYWWYAVYGIIIAVTIYIPSLPLGAYEATLQSLKNQTFIQTIFDVIGGILTVIIPLILGVIYGRRCIESITEIEKEESTSPDS